MCGDHTSHRRGWERKRDADVLTVQCGQGYTGDTHEQKAILIFKVLVKSEWVWQHVIDPVDPVKSYPGVISIHQICLENILRVP